MRSEEGSGKTREEAIQAALNVLSIEMADVDNIEIIDEGSRGIFGLGARPVRVRLTANHLPDLPKPKPAPRQAPQDATPRDAQPQRSEKPRQEQREQRRDQRPEQRRDQRPEQRPEQRREQQQQRGKQPQQQQQRGRDQSENRQRGGAPANRNERQQPQRQQQQQQRQQAEGRGGQRQQRPQRGPRPEQHAPRPVQQAPKESAEELDDDVLSAVPVDVLPAEACQEDMDSAIAITDDQGKEAAALLGEIIAKMEIAATVEFARAEDGTARLNIESEDSAILIGRKGRTLSAMQYLINRIASCGDTAENTERLVVDVEGYVGRRRSTLEEMALAFARRAKETGRNMRLKPLSPQERRIIHLTLQNDEDIRTYSLGDSLYRSVIISPRNAQPDRGPRPQRSGPPRSRGGRDGNRGPRPGGNRPPRAPRQGAPRREEELDPGSFGD